MKSVRVLFFLSISFALLLSCNSKRITGPKVVPDLKIYTTADGLVRNLIFALAVDSLDRVWVGTLGGINILDGVKLDTIDASDGLPYEYVKVLHFDHQGNLWIGSGGNGNGLVKYDGTTFTLYTSADGLSDNRIEAIGSQPNGTIWVGTDVGGACRFDGNQWTCFDATYINHRHVQSIYCENDSSVWIGTSDGVAHYDGKNWSQYLRGSDNVEPVDWYKQIRAITFDSNGVGWFGCAVAVYRYITKAFEFLWQYKFSEVGDIAIDSKGRVWLSSYDSGVYCYWNGTVTNYSMEQGLPTVWVTSVAVDSKGNVWLGTGSGLVRLQLK